MQAVNIKQYVVCVCLMVAVVSVSNTNGMWPADEVGKERTSAVTHPPPPPPPQFRAGKIVGDFW